MNAPAVVMWFRDDLRLEDNPALNAAVRSGLPVVPVYVWPSEDRGDRNENQRWWALQSLRQLDLALRARQSRLILLRGLPEKVLTQYCEAVGADQVYCNRAYDPHSIRRDLSVKLQLQSRQIHLRDYPGNVMHEPGEVMNKTGGHYRVFTAFWNACQSGPKSIPVVPAPNCVPFPDKSTKGKAPHPTVSPEKLTLEQLEREIATPRLAYEWEPGEHGALKSLGRFLSDAVQEYKEDRDRPDKPGTSRLSPHLHFGEISPRQVLQTMNEVRFFEENARGAEAFIRQLYWRDFSIQLLFHEPHTIDQPLQDKFSHFPWKHDEGAFLRWKEGNTGYPYIDAAMRELKKTGWMHNRPRMAVASFLVKDLMIPWQRGAEWFRETLLDADWANNTMGWQWAAGCGADAAPFFRIFNPVTQGERFDPEGDYVRHWVPEISHLPNKYLHRPFSTPKHILQKAQIHLGTTYPTPIVDHATARKEALEALSIMQAMSGE